MKKLLALLLACLLVVGLCGCSTSKREACNQEDLVNPNYVFNE